ncbi:MAG: PD40 domain-containing protein [Flavobacteriales bacterium]|nr:PD40 domain-containing protein [Flavobacteriales bacterium]
MAIGRSVVLCLGALVFSSPLFAQGDQIAWFSKRDSFPDIHLMTADEPENARRITKSADREYGYAWSPDGRLLAYNRYVKDSIRMEVLDMEADSVVRSGPWNMRVASWSPDGSALLMVAKDSLGKDQVFGMAWPGGSIEQLTTNRYGSSSPRYAPDGQRIVFLRLFPPRDTTVHKVDGELMIMDLRTRSETRIHGTARFDGLPDWSPNGAWIAYHSCDTSGCHLRMVRPNGSDDTALVQDGFDNRWPAWSPDGQWIAYTSVRPRSTELVIVRPDGTGMQQLTDNDGRDEAGAWRPRNTH